MYKWIQLEILSIARFDENSDLSASYLRRVDMTKNSKIKAEESFPISEQGYTMVKLLDGMEFQVLLDTGASKSFMSRSHYLCSYWALLTPTAISAVSAIPLFWALAAPFIQCLLLCMLG